MDEQDRVIDLNEMLESIADGHAVYDVEFANLICRYFGAEPLQGSPMYSDPPGTFKGLTMNEGGEGSICVTALHLGGHIVRTLGVEDKVMGFHGRGSRGRENARVIGEYVKANWSECDRVRAHLSLCAKDHSVWPVPVPAEATV